MKVEECKHKSLLPFLNTKLKEREENQGFAEDKEAFKVLDRGS